jgi:hypothetical protein
LATESLKIPSAVAASTQIGFIRGSVAKGIGEKIREHLAKALGVAIEWVREVEFHVVRAIRMARDELVRHGSQDRLQ